MAELGRTARLTFETRPLPRAGRGCRHCGKPLQGRRSNAWFCGDACRVRAHRRRHAGLAEHAYPAGAARGQVPLGQPTRAEIDEELRELAWAAVRARLTGWGW